MDFQIVRSLPLETWRTFVEGHPKGNIFHTPEMFEVFHSTKYYTPELWAATDKERVLVMMAPVHIALKGGLLQKLTVRSVVFGGIICEDTTEGCLALNELLCRYKQRMRRESLFTEIRNLSSMEGVQSILSDADFQYENHLNYLIKLEQSAEDVFNRIGPRTRKNIRRGLRRNDVRVAEVTDRKQIPICYELLHRTYQNAHVPLADISLFYSAFDRLVPKRMARFTLAFVGNEPASVSVELLYKEVIYGWYGGIDRRFIAQVPNEILTWNILAWGCQNNYHVYDFGGAGKPNEKYGVRDFKAKFGGDLVCFGRNTWIARPMLMDVSKLAYSALRHLLFSNGGCYEKRRHQT